jgi:hypothetical protein
MTWVACLPQGEFVNAREPRAEREMTGVIANGPPPL